MRLLFKAGADPAEARRLREEADAVGALLCGALRDIDDADAIQGLCAVLSPPPLPRSGRGFLRLRGVGGPDSLARPEVHADARGARLHAGLI